MTDLTKLTVDQLRAEILVPENGVTFAEATNELARRAQANDTLRSAAQRVDREFEDTKGAVSGDAMFELGEALAAAPAPSSSGAPAPADSQREAAIEAWRDMAMQDSMDADGNYVGFTPCAEGVGTPDELFALRREEIDEAVSLMRSAPPAPVAPVTEGEVEAAIYRADEASFDHGRHTGTGAADTSRGHAKRWKAIDKLRALIARRVAEARGAGLRDLRARLVDFCRIRDRGYDVRSDFSPLWVLDEIDRLLAAPPASKLAEEPAQEDDGPCLSALLANMRMEMSDGANGMRTPREEAIAAVVECVARRIEALENNKEAGK